MSTSSLFHLEIQGITCGPIHNLSFAWPAGVSWVCGDENKGKTTLLRLLASDVQPTAGQVVTPEGGAFWIDLQSSAHDAITVQTCWDQLRTRHPRWSDEILNDLADALNMDVHREKQLHMLSAGSRRKVMVIAALASGAAVTLLDQPFTALDFGSIRIIKEFLQEAAEHPNRAWIVADYTAPNDVPLASVLNLDDLQ
jgi:ABC-type multidrug transport system ATPase subunit